MSERSRGATPRTGKHPRSADLGRFVRGELPRETAREVVRHLLAGCAECRRATGAWWPRELTAPDPLVRAGALATGGAAGAGADAGGAGAEPGTAAEPRRAGREAYVVALGARASAAAYRPMFDRVARNLAARERLFAAERLAARELRTELAPLPAEERRKRVEGDPELHTWPMVEALLEESRDRGFTDAADAIDLARLAIAIAGRLDEERYSAAAVFDLRARAWSHLGNALRIGSRFREAQEAFDTAREHLERGSGDVAERCRILTLQATLYGDQRRFEEAYGLLERVVRAARRVGEGNIEGGALLRMARLAQLEGAPERAADLFARSLDRIEPHEEPRQMLVASHNLVHLLVDLGRPREALERLDSVRSLHESLGGRLDLLRFRWLEARVFEELGWLGKAIDVLTEVRQGFLEDDLAFDVALASLDLATIYSRLDRREEVRRLAEETLPIFQSRAVHREALATFLVFHDAARRERASVSLIREVAGKLRRVIRPTS